MKEIPLTQGKVALVDDEDFAFVNQRKWYAYKDRNTFYARRQQPRVGGKQKTLLLHIEIMRPPVGLNVDHINGDGLDNRRSNLRLATSQQNTQNRGKTRRNKSGYKGVLWNPEIGKWQAKIRINGEGIYLGVYVNAVDAAHAYDAAATELFGEFARLNFAKEE